MIPPHSLTRNTNRPGDVSCKDSLLRSGDESSRLAAVEGLRAAATTHPKTVCAAMKTIIENRTKIYTWENHQTAIELIGQLQCEHGEDDRRRRRDEDLDDVPAALARRFVRVRHGYVRGRTTTAIAASAIASSASAHAESAGTGVVTTIAPLTSVRLLFVTLSVVVPA